VKGCPILSSVEDVNSDQMVFSYPGSSAGQRALGAPPPVLIARVLLGCQGALLLITALALWVGSTAAAMIGPAPFAGSIFSTVNPAVVAVVAASIVIPVVLIVLTFLRRPSPPLAILLIEFLYVVIDFASGFGAGLAPLAIEAEAAALILMAGPVVLAGLIVGSLWVPTSARSFFRLDKAVDNIV
jgi:hypothetical protein